MLTIYNTLTQRKEPFTPLQAGKVRLYVCGLTTYDYAHIGHARMLVAFDVVVRYLRAMDYEVTYVRNITDIDDKIIRRANENGEPFDALTARFIAYTHEDEAALGILRPDIEPRATGYIPQIIAMTETLIAKGHAYAADNGDVYYAVASFPNYARLSRKNPEELLAGARIEIGESKRDPRDFALWKAAKPGEPGWESPWGFGRPGWHIECSAMSTTCLGHTFDIHGGGSDLMFPHHDNEIAQSEGATGERFVGTWMHNGPVRVDDEKMSKSLGNFFTVREVLAQYPAQVLRYFLLASHYRSAINYSQENLDAAHAALERLYHSLRTLEREGTAPAADTDFEVRFHRSMQDDFNTSEALGVLFELAREANRLRDEDPARAAALAALLRQLGGILGLLEGSAEEFLRAGGGEVDAAHVEALIARRKQARLARDWNEADRIRDELKALNVVLEDRDGVTSWRIERA
ncbi:MAG TPA: cysteine--tRNA ligase [Hyphomicrobiales bacterium]|nr:cysteine--tRNA ligase [Hyphomicrobiales bacterium]